MTYNTIKKHLIKSLPFTVPFTVAIIVCILCIYWPISYLSAPITDKEQRFIEWCKEHYKDDKEALFELKRMEADGVVTRHEFNSFETYIKWR